MTEYDVLIIGAGILGLSTAYHIKLADPNLKVLVVDKKAAAGLGSTVNSAAAFRCFFSSQSNYALVDSSVEFYRHIEEDLGVDLKMRWCGYLWAFAEDEYLRLFSLLKDFAIRGITREYKPDELAQILEMRVNFEGDKEAGQFNINDVYKAVFIPKAGLIGVMQLVHFYETEFKKLGGEMRFQTEVTKLLVEPKNPNNLPGEPYFWQESNVVGVETSKGPVRAKKTVIAAGPWISKLLDSVGVECFVKPRKRQVFNVRANNDQLKKLLRTSDFSKVGFLPFIILPPHIYLRPNIEGEGFGVAYSDDFPRPFLLEENPKPETDFYVNGLSHIIGKYFPQFESAPLTGGFAGLYEINTLDEQPVIFEEHGLIVVGGGSGSGIMKADSIGRVAAAVYVGQKTAMLYGDHGFNVSDLSLKNRRVDLEMLII